MSLLSSMLPDGIQPGEEIFDDICLEVLKCASYVQLHEAGLTAVNTFSMG